MNPTAFGYRIRVEIKQKGIIKSFREELHLSGF